MDNFPSKIRSKSKLGKIYDFGKTAHSTDRKIKANYLFDNNINPPVLEYAVTISSKSGNSVWRNRFKRLIRESIKLEFRINAEIVFTGSLSIIFSPGTINQNNSGKIFLKDIKPAVADLLYKIRMIIERT